MIIYVKGIFFGGIMQKVNGFINKNLNLIITIFIIIQPILDLVVSLSLNVFHKNVFFSLYELCCFFYKREKKIFTCLLFYFVVL